LGEMEFKYIVNHFDYQYPELGILKIEKNGNTHSGSSMKSLEKQK